MSLVIDAGFVVAALVDSGPVGTWAEELLAHEDLAAPHLMPVEAANVLRRAVSAGDITADTAAMSHADLLSMRVELFSYEPFATRCGSCGGTSRPTTPGMSALVESLNARLATVDVQLTKAIGPGCSFVTSDTGAWPPPP
jgi:hypothetical protein